MIYTPKQFIKIKICVFADKPDSITLEWEHSINKPGSVQANQEYKLKCVTKNSHPPATHRYFKGGVELSQSKMEYTFNNYTDKVELHALLLLSYFLS